MKSIIAFSLLFGLAMADNLCPAMPIKASFTQYGTGDERGSGNCLRSNVSCSYFGQGFYAAISQNFFGAGQGEGPGCEKCWLLTPQTDENGNKLQGAHSIVVKINDLCPADGNVLCAQNGTNGVNMLGANVNIDTCIDSGASSALFGTSGTGLALGTAQIVDCSQWGGSPTTTAGPGHTPVPSSCSPNGASSAPGNPSNPSGAPTATVYGQCGGQGYTGPTACPGGSTCQAQNQFYAQCLPASGNGGSSPPPSSTSGPAPATQTMFGQCGGNGYTGPTACPAGTTCQYQNDFYSQCLSPNKVKKVRGTGDH